MLRLRTSCKPLVLVLAALPAYSQEIIQPGTSKGSAENRPAARPNGHIVQFVKGTSQGARALAAMQAGAAIRYNYATTEAIAVTVPNENALNSLRRNAAVTKIAPDFIVEAAVVRGNAKGGGRPPGGGGTLPSLGLSTTQQVSYEVQRVGIPAAGSDGTGIGIAVLDSGIDFNHPDLAPAANANGTAFNATAPGSSCQDDGGHGTHVSGLIAALNNGIGILGVAPAAKLYCVKVLDSGLTGSDSQVMAGLDWVVQNHASVTPRIRVVNMSLGRPLESGETLNGSPWKPMIQALYNAGVVVVVAVGNNPDLETTQMLPGGFPEVVKVASTTANNGIRTCILFGDPSLGPVSADTASGFTTDGPEVTVSAPGEERSDIVTLGSFGCVGLEYGTLSTTLNTGGVSRKLVPGLYEARGTSFAAPLVAGAVARVMQKQIVPSSFDSAEVEQIRSWLQTNANRKNAAPLDHPWAGEIYSYTFDGVREGIAQAPQ